MPLAKPLEMPTSCRYAVVLQSRRREATLCTRNRDGLLGRLLFDRFWMFMRWIYVVQLHPRYHCS